MKLWENKIGRPSNEILAKRRTVKTIVLASVVLVMIITTAFITGLNASKLVGSNNTIQANYRVMGINGGIVADEIYYSKSNYIDYNSIKSNRVFVGDTGTRKIRILISFNSKEQISKIIIKDNNETVPCWRSGVGKKGSIYCDLTVKKTTKYYDIKITSVNGPYLNKRINVAMWPSVSIEPVDKLTLMEKDNDKTYSTYSVNKYKKYYNNVRISNPSGAPLYYRWFTYKRLSMSAGTFNVAGDCHSISKTSYSYTGASLTVNSSYPKRSGIIKVYSTYQACVADPKGLNNNNLAYWKISFIK